MNTPSHALDVLRCAAAMAAPSRLSLFDDPSIRCSESIPNEPTVNSASL
ncbi:hypothetical protein BN2537_6563 [Streptomyces venezuelae]|nr:hypothetical protein BN2537_6563 [Streptomyces venezuelae]